MLSACFESTNTSSKAFSFGFHHVISNTNNDTDNAIEKYLQNSIQKPNDEKSKKKIDEMAPKKRKKKKKKKKVQTSLPLDIIPTHLLGDTQVLKKSSQNGQGRVFRGSRKRTSPGQLLPFCFNF